MGQRATLLWYHDHRMDFTAPAVWRGLAGLHIVRDDVEDALGLPSGPRELPLMITDRAFSADGRLDLVQVGADQGLLAAPVVHRRLPVAPAERYDVVVDFSGVPVGGWRRADAVRYVTWPSAPGG